jgi:hypothetical protein
MRLRGTGVRQTIQPRHLPEDPEPGGSHQWVITGAWRLSEAEAERQATGKGGEVHLDVENLLAVDGPGCWVCEQVWTPAIARSACPGDPARRYGDWPGARL